MSQAGDRRQTWLGYGGSRDVEEFNRLKHVEVQQTTPEKGYDGGAWPHDH